MCTSAGVAVNIWGWVYTAGVGLHICTGPCLCAAWGMDDVQGYACALGAPQAMRCSRAAGKVAAEPALSLSPSRRKSPLALLSTQFQHLPAGPSWAPPKPARGTLFGAFLQVPLAHSTHLELP